MKIYKKALDIKVAAIGYGAAFNMGRQHLNEMKAAGMTPVAVADIDPARLNAARADFPGIETYGSTAEMLKKSAVQLVTVITPHNTHAPLALQCLRAGRHVVTEKPFSITTAECDAMIREAKKQGVMLSTYHNRHWDGCILRAVEQIRKGVIGEVFRIEAHMSGYNKPREWWRTSKTISGGILYDWGVHLLEYSLQIIQSEIAEVSGFTKTGFWAPQTPWKKDTIEDEGFAAVRFRNGARVTLLISSLDANPKRGWLEITGTKGSYVFDGPTWEIATVEDGVKTVRSGQNPPSQGQEFYKNVAAHLTKGARLVITPEWSRRPIHILDLACQSAKKGAALKAKYK
ncbi:MAG: Gfo/Idh/MocA family oxidoreductase [Candidatus Sumerlaeota bacterium]|nr:Gfo/Idh/MocA family oxidoreductase [Candidatus Sumerlaeota bacterium]